MGCTSPDSEAQSWLRERKLFRLNLPAVMALFAVFLMIFPMALAGDLDRIGQIILSSFNATRLPPAAALYSTLTGHAAAVRSVAWAPEGNPLRLISGSNDKTVKVWDPTPGTGTCLQTLTGHNNKVLSVDIKNGHILSGSKGVIKVWKAPTTSSGYSLLRDIEVRNRWWANSVAFNPFNGEEFVVGDAEIERLNLFGDSLQILRGHDGPVESVAYAKNADPSGVYIVSGSTDRTAKVWNLLTGENIYTREGHTGVVRSVDLFFASGSVQEVVSGSNDDTIRTPLATMTCSSRVLSVAYSPNLVHGDIATGEDNGDVKVWTVAGHLLHTFSPPIEMTGAPKLAAEPSVFSVAWSPDGRFIAAAYKYPHVIRIWDVLAASAARNIKTERLI